MNVLFVSSGTIDPATRFRISQFLPHFERAGIRCHHRGAYGERYNDFFGTPLAPVYKLGCRFKRAAQTVSALGYDLIFLQRTAFNGSALPERLAAARGAHLVYDVDDAVFLMPDGSAAGARERAFRDVVRVSKHIVAGNRFLATHAAAPAKTTVIPTVIDADAYTPAPAGERRAGSGRVVIGWMGTAGNFAYFSSIVPAILTVLDEFPEVVFRIVSNGHLASMAEHPKVEQVPWSADTELDELRGFDIGIMPLDDTPWTQGKCGFKLIQYMAVGKPVVASPVGANRTIVDGSGAGFLPAGPREWAEALRNLIGDRALREAMGRAGRQRIESAYSVRSVVRIYLGLFEKLAGSGMN